MKSKHERKAWQWVLGASMLFTACGVAQAGTGGTIYLSGAIVEPTFQITAAPGSFADASSTSAPAWTVEPDCAVSIAYVAAPNARAYAEVSIVALGGNAGASHATPAPVSVSVADGAVYRRQVDGSGRYGIGSAGGVIRLQAGDLSQATGPTLVAVVTSYQ
ncbi:hypothetical protein ACFSHT_20900 [Paraburkholderia silviterrae]|uniref:Type 1 fimbria pilin n=1 Tax=Paraburkholderia silviterrae TaxID=2528715 RepID=A0A4R5LZR6_9BURK|nr:hypothetical protein [Paraburkholderia silviterrae]TDG18190.1 hypothetical protein EYW47_35420 [Paraburkholderia silviterrae]